VRARSEAPDEDRLGLTATIIASTFAAVIGLGVGLITTFTHRLLPPVGLIAGLLIVGALVAGFRLVFDSRIVAAAAALGVLVAVAILALPGAGGSVVVADGIIGYVWVLGTPLIAAAVVLWPGIRPRANE
jgi:N-acetyl-1-D-myo-inositol-2-amino-2-deoxy-alpha-D-glucopyranoside deacetylase